MLFDQFSEPQSLVEFAYQGRAAVGGDTGTLDNDLFCPFVKRNLRLNYQVLIGGRETRTGEVLWRPVHSSPLLERGAV
jgi:hypothetical protein